MLAAWRSASKVLWRSPGERTVRDRLAELAAGGAQLLDPDEPVDIYGDGLVETLEQSVAALLGFPAAAFFPTGTMAQQVALRCWAQRTGNPVVALHPTAHPELHERAALTSLTGLRTVHLTGEPRQPTAAEVRGFDEEFATLLLELPLREAGFVLPTLDELTAVVAAARDRRAIVHVDGARLWECPSHFGRTLPEIAALADSVYVSFYKSLGAISGAAIAGPESFVAEAKAWRHRYGGQVFTQFPVVLSALHGLGHELPRLASYVEHAGVVAAALREELAASGTWWRMQPDGDRPHTHQFRVWLPHEPGVLTTAAVEQAEETGVALFRRWFPPGPFGPPGLGVTEVSVTSPGLAWSAQDVREATRDFLARLP
ncbi:beta-eliminating lyase-related protein [Actinomycetes bacterium KLBMP 9759]